MKQQKTAMALPMAAATPAATSTPAHAFRSANFHAKGFPPMGEISPGEARRAA